MVIQAVGVKSELFYEVRFLNRSSLRSHPLSLSCDAKLCQTQRKLTSDAVNCHHIHHGVMTSMFMQMYGRWPRPARGYTSSEAGNNFLCCVPRELDSCLVSEKLPTFSVLLPLWRRCTAGSPGTWRAISPVHRPAPPDPGKPTGIANSKLLGGF